MRNSPHKTAVPEAEAEEAMAAGMVVPMVVQRTRLMSVRSWLHCGILIAYGLLFAYLWGRIERIHFVVFP